MKKEMAFKSVPMIWQNLQNQQILTKRQHFKSRQSFKIVKVSKFWVLIIELHPKLTYFFPCHARNHIQAQPFLSFSLL